jgi:hypothetical protein
MHRGANGARGAGERAKDSRTDRIAHGHVRDDTILKKGRGALFGQIDKLIGQEQMPWLDDFFHATNGAD